MAADISSTTNHRAKSKNYLVNETSCRPHEGTPNRYRLNTYVNQYQERLLETTLGYTPKPASFDGATT